LNLGEEFAEHPIDLVRFSLREKADSESEHVSYFYVDPCDVQLTHVILVRILSCLYKQHKQTALEVAFEQIKHICSLNESHVLTVFSKVLKQSAERPLILQYLQVVLQNCRHPIVILSCVFNRAFFRCRLIKLCLLDKESSLIRLDPKDLSEF